MRIKHRIIGKNLSIMSVSLIPLPQLVWIGHIWLTDWVYRLHNSALRPCLHENGENAHENARKRYPKWKLLKTTTFWLRVNSVNDVCEVETDRFVGVPIGVAKRAAWPANAWFSSALFYYFYWWSSGGMLQQSKSTLPFTTSEGKWCAS